MRVPPRQPPRGTMSAADRVKHVRAMRRLHPKAREVARPDRELQLAIARASMREDVRPDLYERADNESG